jgi:hypothetical protein
MTGRACGESRLTRALQDRELVWLIDVVARARQANNGQTGA